MKYIIRFGAETWFADASSLHVLVINATKKSANHTITVEDVRP